MNQNLSERSRAFLAKKDIHAEWLSDYLNPDIDRFYDLAFAEIISKANILASDTILDAGCGYCHHTLRLARSGATIVGVDFSEVALAEAEKTIRRAGLSDRVSLIQGDVTALNFAPNSFNVVVCWGVLMHVPNLESALDQFARILKPNGCLVLSEVNMRSLDVRLREAAIRGIKTVLGRSREIVAMTERGLETWRNSADGGLMVRKSDLEFIRKYLEAKGLYQIERRSGQFSEAYAGLHSRTLKKIIYRFNEFYFRRGLSPNLALSNILIFKKG